MIDYTNWLIGVIAFIAVIGYTFNQCQEGYVHQAEYDVLHPKIINDTTHTTMIDTVLKTILDTLEVKIETRDTTHFIDTLEVLNIKEVIKHRTVTIVDTNFVEYTDSTQTVLPCESKNLISMGEYQFVLIISFLFWFVGLIYLFIWTVTGGSSEWGDSQAHFNWGLLIGIVAIFFIWIGLL